MKRTLALWFLLWPCLAFGQAPVLVGEDIDPKDVKAAEARIKTDTALVEASRAGKKIALNVGEFEVFHPMLDKDGKPAITGPVTWLAINTTIARKIEIPAGAEFVFVGKRRGESEEVLHEYKAEKFRWWIVIGRKQGGTPLVLVENGKNPDKDPPKVADQFDLTVGAPIPPVPPGPTPPGPTPPGPTPGPAPIPVLGLRVLIVFESADLSRLPASQIAAIRAKEVIDYLDAKCVKADDTAEWRMLDQHTPMNAASPIWQEAMKRPRQSLPWILISDGKTGYEGALPKDKDELMKLLKTYGGN